MQAVELKPVNSIVAAARSGPARTLSMQTRQSHPIPVRSNGEIKLYFLFATQVADPKEGILLVAPSYMAVMDAATGNCDEMSRVTPAAFNQLSAPGAFIGAHKLPPGMTADEYRAHQEQLYKDYDILLPLFAANAVAVAPQARDAAKEVHTFFPLLVEAPLLPYYQIIGAEFFAWVDGIARPTL